MLLGDLDLATRRAVNLGITERKNTNMALSDQLAKLAARTKKAEDRAAAAQQKAKADLEQEVTTAREAAQAQSEELRKSAEATKGKVSAWWDSVEKAWNDHLAAVHKHVEERKAAIDKKVAER